MDDRDVIYKICGQDEWDEALRTSLYRGSTDDRRDGYIHFSRADQLRTTAAKYFSGRRDLVLIAVARGSLGAALRDEPSRGGDLFPHLYADLPVAAAEFTCSLPWDGSEHVFPSALGGPPSLK